MLRERMRSKATFSKGNIIISDKVSDSSVDNVVTNYTNQCIVTIRHNSIIIFTLSESPQIHSILKIFNLNVPVNRT